MFELKIASLREALRIQPWATHTISLLDPDFATVSTAPDPSVEQHFDFATVSTAPEPSAEQQVLRCLFHDISKEDFTVHYSQPKMATPQHIQEILAFTAPLKSSDRLLVHCHAGLSRSTATACGILCQHGLTPIEAVKSMLSIRPQAFPNQHIIKLFDDILALKGELMAAAHPRQISKLCYEQNPGGFEFY